MTGNNEDPAASTLAATDLSRLFRPDASVSERRDILAAFVGAVRLRLRDVTSAAGDNIEVLSERTGRILSELVDKIPIRRAEDLRQAFGEDVGVRADRVIDDAARLAGWLWWASSAPGPVVHAVKVILHSAIEIRMVGELYEAHRSVDVNPVPTPLPTVLTTWLHGGLLDGDPAAFSTAALVAQVRRAFGELRASGGVVRQALVGRGKEGEKLIRTVGQRIRPLISSKVSAEAGNPRSSSEDDERSSARPAS